MRVHPTSEQIRESFARLSGDPSFAESRQLFERGRLPVEMIQAMSMRPEVLRVLACIGDAAYPGGLLERRLKELVILRSSRDNECQFCTASHVAMTRKAGLADDPLDLLDHPEGQTDRERLAIEYTRAAMADSNRVPESLFSRLRAAFSEPEIVELTFLIGVINMLNLFNNCLQVRYHDDYQDVRANA